MDHHASQAWPALQEVTIRWRGGYGYLIAWAGDDNDEQIPALPDVAAKKQAEKSAEQQAAAEFVRLAKEQGSSRRLADELLKQLTKTVLETR